MVEEKTKGTFFPRKWQLTIEPYHLIIPISSSCCALLTKNVKSAYFIACYFPTKKWKCNHLVMSDSLGSPLTVAFQAPLYMEFSKQEYWSECQFLLQGMDHPDPGIELGSPSLQADSLLSEPQGNSSSFPIGNIFNAEQELFQPEKRVIPNSSHIDMLGKYLFLLLCSSVWQSSTENRALTAVLCVQLEIAVSPESSKRHTERCSKYSFKHVLTRIYL